MGEVRVHVKLTNAGDESRVRTGELRSEDVCTFEGDALVDTGAIRTVIPPAVMKQLGLPSFGQKTAHYADGRREIVDVSAPVMIRIGDRVTTESALVLGDEVLIGQTALEDLDLHVDCANQKLIPNPKHPNEPVVRV